MIPARFSEPSTWAGLAAMLASLAHLAPENVRIYVLGAAGLCASLSVVLSEKGAPPEQIITDALNAAKNQVKPGSGTVPALLLGGLLAAGALVACTPADLARFDSASNRVVVQGQLFCGKATAAGPLVIALADASGVPITVTGRASGTVQALCAAVGGMPVLPPPVPSQAPVVAAPVDAGK